MLTAEPPWNTLPAATPMSVRRLLRRCLQKDRKRRLDSASVARQDLDDALDEPASPPSEANAHRFSWRHVGAAAAGALIVSLIAGALAVTRPSPATREGILIRLPLVMPESELVESLALSPDGRRVAVGSIRLTPRVLVRALDSTEVQELAGTEGGVMPFWSPDGTTVAYFALDGRLRSIDVGGGSPRAVTETPLAFDPVEVGGTWGTDDVILFGHAGAIRRVSAAGGASAVVDLEDGAPAGAMRRSPQFLPGGQHFIYAVGLPSQPVEIRVGSLNSARTVVLRRADSHAVYDPNGHLLFLLGSTLMAQQFDAPTRTLGGPEFSVASNAAAGFVGGAPSFSSSHGVLAYVSPRGGVTGLFTWFDRSGASLGSVAQPAGVQYLNPALSPDERRVAVNMMDQLTGNWDVWVIDLESQVPLRLTSDPASDTDPVWSPDGRAIAFASNRGGVHGLYRKRLGGDGAEELLLATRSAATPSDWSDDGRFLIYTTSGDTTSWDVMALPLVGATRTPQPIAHSRFNEYGGSTSPDGQWIAYASDDTGGFQAYVQRFPATGPRQPVSSDGGTHARWRRDGLELFYTPFTGPPMAVDVRVAASELRLGTPRPALPRHIAHLNHADARPHYAVSNDGKRFLLRQPLGRQDPPINVVINWAGKTSTR